MRSSAREGRLVEARPSRPRAGRASRAGPARPASVEVRPAIVDQVIAGERRRSRARPRTGRTRKPCSARSYAVWGAGSGLRNRVGHRPIVRCAGRGTETSSQAARDAASRYGTPCYLYDLPRLDADARRWPWHSPIRGCGSTPSRRTGCRRSPRAWSAPATARRRSQRASSTLPAVPASTPGWWRSRASARAAWSCARRSRVR